MNMVDSDFLRPVGWGWFPLRGERARMRALNEKYERILAGTNTPDADDEIRGAADTPSGALDSSVDDVDGATPGGATVPASPDADELAHELQLAAALDRARPSLSPDSEASTRMRRRLFEAMAEEGFSAEARTDPAVVDAVVHIADELAVQGARREMDEDDEAARLPTNRRDEERA